MPTEFLITGAGGLLAGALRRSLADRGKSAAFLIRQDCDVRDVAAVENALAAHRPRVVLNCAAYAKVDQAESEPAQADAINADAVGFLATAAKRHRARIVHYSTDFVFNGRSARPYLPDDPVDPLSAYGRSKLLGEKLLHARAQPGDWLLLRTAWLYGIGGPCFPRTIVERAKARQPLRVVSDQIGSPTYVNDLADATLELLDRGAAGIWHVVNSGATSWFNFAAAICRAFNLTADLTPVTTAQWTGLRPGQAVRPAYSVLDTTAYTQAVRPLRSWQEALADYAQSARQSATA